MTTSFIKNPKLPNFGHIATSTGCLELREKNLLAASWTETMTT